MMTPILVNVTMITSCHQVPVIHNKRKFKCHLLMFSSARDGALFGIVRGNALHASIPNSLWIIIFYIEITIWVMKLGYACKDRGSRHRTGL